jgi:hypothetical protein
MVAETTKRWQEQFLPPLVLAAQTAVFKGKLPVLLIAELFQT